MPRIGTLLALLGLLASPVFGHDFPSERDVMIQVEPDAIVLFVSYKETNKERIGLLMAQYDINRNGTIEPMEGQLIAAKLLPVALDGFHIRCKEMRSATQVPKLKWQHTKDSLSMAALTTYPLASPATSITLSLNPKATPIDITLRSPQGTLTRQGKTPQKSTSFKDHIHPGQAFTFSYKPNL